MLIQKRFEHIVSFYLADASFGKGCISNCMYPALTICQYYILHSVRILLPFPAFFHKKLMTIGTISGWKFSHTVPCLLSHKSLMSCSWEPNSLLDKIQRKIREKSENSIIFLNPCFCLLVFKKIILFSDFSLIFLYILSSKRIWFPRARHK